MKINKHLSLKIIILSSLVLVLPIITQLSLTTFAAVWDPGAGQECTHSVCNTCTGTCTREGCGLSQPIP